MLWIKRNLFLAIGGLLVVALLALGVVYLMSGIQKNAKLDTETDETKNAGNNVYGLDPFPHATNISAIKRDTEIVRDAVNKARAHFTPVPVERVTGFAFLQFRDNMLDEMRRMAGAARTKLPADNYAFSFEAQKLRPDFGPGTFPLVPQQMAEVKAICSILFGARIRELGHIRRAKVSEDDHSRGLATDYHTMPIETNSVGNAVISPYEFSFYCLTAELSEILAGFNKSKHALIVKAMQVEPHEGAKTTDATTTGAGGVGALAPPLAGQPRRPGFPQQLPPRQPGRPPQQGYRRPSGEVVTVLLQERRVKVTMLLHVVKQTNAR